MTKPSDNEINTAIQQAEQMRIQNDDAHHVAKVLLHLNNKAKILDKIFHASDAYVNHGGFPQQHAELARALEEIKKLEMTERDSDETDIGLG